MQIASVLSRRTISIFPLRSVAQCVFVPGVRKFLSRVAKLTSHTILLFLLRARFRGEYASLYRQFRRDVRERRK